MNRENIKKIHGIMPIYRTLKSAYDYFVFVKQYQKFKKIIGDDRFIVKWSNRLPCLGENTVYTGFDRHYIYHPAWAARILAKTKPALHADISSTLNFCAIVSAFIPIKFYDYRPAKLNLSNLETDKIDLLSLSFADNSIKSLSCMHTIEHVGLGRYGDPINPQADTKVFSELSRVLASDGNLLIVVPIGKPCIQFNAHRIYSYKQIIDSFPKLTLREFSLVPDKEQDGGLIINASETTADAQSYGCGCFWFTKK